MDVIRETRPKAQKDHICDWCELPIKKGAKYHSAIIVDTEIYNWRNHIRCMSIADKLNMFDCVVDGGLDASGFREIISDEYLSMNNAYNKPLPDFKIQLDAVCDKHL